MWLLGYEDNIDVEFLGLYDTEERALKDKSDILAEDSSLDGYSFFITFVPIA